MLRNLWLTFAQAITVGLAALFILATLRPEWLPRQLAPQAPEPPAATVTAPPAPVAAPKANGEILSYADAAQRATPAVVNIFTTKEVRLPRNHPLFNDPLFRRFFGDQPQQQQRPGFFQRLFGGG